MPPKQPVWRLEPHTQAKHELLRKYLAAWFPILTSQGYNRRVLYIDGFCGPGIYLGGEPGSPIIALKTLLEHSFFSRLSRIEFVFYFVDNDPRRCSSLEAEVERLWKAVGGQPDNIKLKIINAEFVDVANSVLGYLREGGRSLAPTFAFIDPFGFKGVPLQLIGELLSFPRCEVFFNFMYDSLNRWIDHPDEKITAHLQDLFGTPNFREAAKLTGEDRKLYLHDLYGKQLSASGFDYVQKFEMIDERNRTVYSLYYGTKHLAGLKVMKQAMWKVDPIAGLRFSDRLAGQQVLFGREFDDRRPLSTALQVQFAGLEEVSVEQVEEYVLTGTPYSASHYKPVLKALQLIGDLEPVNQKRPGQFPPGTTMSFKSLS